MPSKTFNNSKELSTANPQHYKKRGGIEPIDFITSNNLSFTEGCIVKYIYRRKKGDLAKITQYVKFLIDKEGDE